MKLNLAELKNPLWEQGDFYIPEYDIEKIRKQTEEEPKWLHFGAGNIFRAFPAVILQELLNKGKVSTGLIVCEGFDEDIINKIYKPHDNLTVAVNLKANGSVSKILVSSIMESLTMNRKCEEDWKRLEKVFSAPSLQMVSFTITEKGYSLTGADGNFLADTMRDFENGPGGAKSYMGKVAALCYVRYRKGKFPLALVSMDNFSHNGDKLKYAVETYAQEWMNRGLVGEGFLAYIQDSSKISFPWSMIDKITPRPDEKVEKILTDAGLENMHPIITKKNTYIAPFVNAEETQYLVIEDSFPNGRLPLEEAGIIFTKRETVDKVERMKVCTCLNPLHTALAIFGCLLGYKHIYEEMEDQELKKMVETIGYKEGLPVVVNPEIIDPKKFIAEVLEKRFPNPYIPDTPQRIATDTSQKIPVRFGETIRAYILMGKDLHELKLIPLVFAGWIRYLMGVDDYGLTISVSPDPMFEELHTLVRTIQLGDESHVDEVLSAILSKEKIFGVNLYDTCLADKTIECFKAMIKSPGAVRETLKKYVNK